MTCSYSKEFSSSAFTNVENVFIYEYLPVSSGDAVKVYLYGLFLCQKHDDDKSLTDVASDLNMTETEVVDYFKYWEEFGLVNVVSEAPFSVQYLPIRSAYSGKARKYNAEKYTDFTKGIQAIITSRMISTSEYTEYFNIMETYGIKPEAMLMIVQYCVGTKGNDISYRYISKVAKDFGNRGITSVSKVEKELSAYMLRTSEISKILTTLGLKRKPEIEDLAMLKKWTGELNFDVENIIYAASKLKKGSMAKLDEFMLELYAMKSFAKQEIEEYVANKQRVYELAIRINKALSVYMEVIDTVVDTYTKKWISYGFDDDTLLFMASQCFKEGKNTLQNMDKLVEELRERGYITLASVSDYFENLKRTDEFISKLLINAGLSRRPTDWDRKNVSDWKAWNFSEEMILEASKLSAGKSSPIPYITAILSNWKSKGVFTPAEIGTVTAVAPDNSQEAYNREYERRRALAVSRAQKNMETAFELEGFSELYSRINSIEKDLAFAEISGNAEALEKLETEKKEIYAKARSTLQKAGLTLDDLSPKYACEKCKDTGYVGTHRCDCFDKKI